MPGAAAIGHGPAAQQRRENTVADQASRKVRETSERLVHVSELLIVTAAQLLVVVSVLVATFVLYALFFSRLGDALHGMHTIDGLQAAVEKVFAGVLLLVLGLELLKSLTKFFVGFEVQVQIILVVAMIAVTRHVMLVDLEHTDWKTLVGAAALILALAISYVLVRRQGSGSDPDEPAEEG
jgi:uncharacterized membrane protein (DUF373 family)